MAEKVDKQTQATIISATRKEHLNLADETTVTQLGEVGETTMTQLGEVESAGTAVLANAMETVLERLPGSETARKTAILQGDSGTTLRDAKKGASSSEGDPKYELVRSLGKGGFAWVYLVRNVDLNRMEAMKILNTELCEDEEVLERFVREARTSAKFNHQNIVMVYEVQKRGSWQMFQAPEDIMRRHREPFAFFTMSFVEGDTATNLVKKKKRIPQKEAVRIVMDAAAALEYAHAEGVVHRDIKPDNILVDHKGNGIVMDFGIAKAADQTRQTAAGTFMGTARYVSPEQAMGRDIDARSDLYSLGVTLYELSTGRVPFDSDKWMTVLYQHINEPPPSPQKFFGDIDRDLVTVTLKMLEKRPEDRYQTAREVLDVLGSVYKALGGEDRQTQSLDKIETRRDFIVDQNTSSTEVVDEAPPVRTKIHDQTPPPAPTSTSKTPLLVGAFLILAVIGFLFIFDRSVVKQPIPAKPEPVATIAPMGKLLVSAFPRGLLTRVTNEQGQAMDVANQELPQILSLPEGTYKLVVDYRGETRLMEVFVDKNNALGRVSASFDVEDNLFLLEDLR